MTDAVVETTTDAPAAEVPAKKPRKPRAEGPPKSYTRTLVGPTGDQLQFIAYIKKDGSFSTYVAKREKNDAGKVIQTSRGASAVYPDLETAKTELQKGVEAAISAGWKESTTGGGQGNFKRKDDAFTLANLPKPAKAAKK